MITGLLDTNILVDILRGYPPAISWLSGQSALAITPIIWLEILDGVTDTASLIRPHSYGQLNCYAVFLK